MALFFFRIDLKGRTKTLSIQLTLGKSGPGRFLVLEMEG